MTKPTNAELQEELNQAHADLRRMNELASAELKTVVQALLDVARDLGPVMKEQIGSGQYSYQAFSIDTVFDSIRPLFAKHGVVMVPQEPGVTYVERDRVNQQGQVYGVSVDARVRAEYIFYGPDGSSITAGFATEARDTGDKATIQALQQCVKYALIQTFQIAAGDPTAETPPETVAAAPATLSPEEQVKQYVTDAKRHVADLLQGDLDEAAEVWSGVLEKAVVMEILTEADRDNVMAAASEMLGENPTLGAASAAEAKTDIETGVAE